MKSDELKKKLAETKARRKPVLSDAERIEKEEAARLMAELAEEQRALRTEENEDIIEQHAPDGTRAFLDFDPGCVHPVTIVYNGQTCRLHSRFVVRGAHASDLEIFEDAAEQVAAAKKAGKPLDKATEKQLTNTTAKMARSCIVYPTEATLNRSPSEHALDIDASLEYFGGSMISLGNKAGELGGLHVLMQQQKS
jgi:hypothetical protein